MRVIRVNVLGGPEKLTLETAPEPVPGPGQVVVQLEAMGVNYIDTYYRRGLYQTQVPFVPGQEGAGTVRLVGNGVSAIAIGDRVAFTGIMGSYAEWQAVPADRVVKLPSGLRFKDGAAAMLQGMTAHYLATSTFPLRPGHVCLVHAAAGGVGLLLCQIARLRGATVIGTVSTEEKAALARAAGAEHTILYNNQDFEVETRRLTGAAGVDVVYDGVGVTTFSKGLNCLRRRGMMVLFGQSSGPVPPFDLGILNQKGSLFVTRPSLGAYITTREELVERATDVLGWVADGKLKLRIEHVFPLAEATEAHRALEGRKTTGKVLLEP